MGYSADVIGLAVAEEVAAKLCTEALERAEQELKSGNLLRLMDRASMWSWPCTRMCHAFEDCTR